MTTWGDLRHARRLYEDDAVLVLDKPAGLAVIGERHADDLVDLAHAAGETVMPAHRIDKVTSGAIVLAKTADAHAALARQFHRRSIEKAYLAVVHADAPPPGGTIDLPLSVGRKNRVRVAAPRSSIVIDAERWSWSVAPAAVFADKRSYPARTDFAVIGRAGPATLVVAQPVTGRRHQIRVHLAWIGLPIVGDPLFPGPPAPRTYLHAWQVAFDAPWAADARVVVEAVPDAGFWTPLGGEPPAWRPAAEAAIAGFDGHEPGGRPPFGGGSVPS